METPYEDDRYGYLKIRRLNLETELSFVNHEIRIIEKAREKVFQDAIKNAKEKP